MELTFTNHEISITVSPIPGTFKYADHSVDVGGGIYPVIRTNQSVSGSCMVLIDESFTYQDAFALISPAGQGNMNISAPAFCTQALVDVNIAGDGVQTAAISWIGKKSV